MNDRIKLAEAMKIEKPECGSCFGSGRITVSPTFGSEMCTQCEGLGRDWPDPFTDANDDYAVLEWIRAQHFVTHMTYFMDADNSEEVKRSSLAIDYKIGDYARAALKALGDSDE